jgi:hypothetical protein
MLIDSYYDPYLGVVVLIRVVDGIIRKGDRIRMMRTGGTYQIDRLGVFKPAMQDIPELGPGEIGFLTAQIKLVRDTRVGDTITHERKPCDAALPGFKPSDPRRLLRPLPRRRQRVRGPARRHREARPQRRLLHRPRWRPPPPSASASAAASSASSTSRSSATGSSANTTSTSSPPRLRWSTTST